MKDKVAYGAKTTTLIDIRRASVYFQYLGVNGYCWFLRKVVKRITRRKTSQYKGEIQRQIQCTNLHMTPGDPGHIPYRYHTADVMLSASQVMLLIGLFETISDTTGLIYISFQLRCSWQILYFHRNVLEDVTVVRHLFPVYRLNLPSLQFFPVYPGAHVQLYALTRSLHVPLFWHRSPMQSSMSAVSRDRKENTPLSKNIPNNWRI